MVTIAIKHLMKNTSRLLIYTAVRYKLYNVLVVIFGITCFFLYFCKFGKMI